MRDFKHVKIGDTVNRLLAGVVSMPLKVTWVDYDFIYCGSWKFRRDNGAEVDEDLGWDGIHQTGSFLADNDDATP